MKQINFSLIYPYISKLARGSAHKTHIDKIQTKQNQSARLIFFATAYGEHTESAHVVSPAKFITCSSNDYVISYVIILDQPIFSLLEIRLLS